MNEGEIDPFAASESTLKNFAGNDKRIREIRENLFQPALARDLLDMCAAQARLNFLVSAAVIAVSQKNDASIETALSAMVDGVEKSTAAMGRVAAGLILGDRHDIVQERYDGK